MISLTLKELLENKIEFLEADDISDYIRLAFWKENEKWNQYCFYQKKGAISLGDFKTLLWISNTDRQATILNKFGFMISGTDELIDIDRMVHLVEKEYDKNEVDNRNNINNFLKRIIRIKDWSRINVEQFLNFNRENFFSSELGKKLIDSANELQTAYITGLINGLKEERCKATINTIILALKQYYNLNLEFEFDAVNKCGYEYKIVDTDTKNLLYKG